MLRGMQYGARLRWKAECLVVVMWLVAVGWVTSGCGRSKATTGATAGATGAAPVRVAQAQTRMAPVEVATVGNVEAWSTIAVKAQIGGVLVKVHFREGEMVKQGELLFEIDARPYEQAIRQIEANLARSRALLAQAEANLGRAQAQEAHYAKQAERYEKLAEEGIFSREQAEQMAVELRARRSSVRAEAAARASAQAAIEAEQAALETARLNLSYCTIRSPIAGRTGRLLVKEGNLVKANDVELVSIHQIQPVYVSFAVPEQHLLRIRQRMAGGGLTAFAAIPGDEAGAAAGAVSFVDNAVDRATGTIPLKATFANAAGRLWPGQFVDVRLRLEERPNAVVVPAAAMQVGQQGAFVYVVKPDQTVEQRAVKAGPRLKGEVAIEEGLSAGETVVTEGQLRLAPGMKVQVRR
jgi:multidrug efflux system membrane fusion protein